SRRPPPAARRAPARRAPATGPAAVSPRRSGRCGRCRSCLVPRLRGVGAPDAAEQQFDEHVGEVLGCDPALGHRPGGGGEQSVERLGEPGGAQVDTELAVLLAPQEEGGEGVVDAGPAVVLLLALEELVL